MKVPFVDLKRSRAEILDSLHETACGVIDGCQYIGGEEVQGFERELARWLGVEEICGGSCATMGLFSVLRSLGIGPGDEVITTVHTAIATAEAISLTGAQVVFCDLQEGYFNLDPSEAASKISARTRALVPVHLYGQPAAMDDLLALAKEHDVYVVEDCAQALGARYRGKFVGTLGHAAVFSFFPSKPLGGFGDGGAMTARDPETMRKIRMFSNHGRETKYRHEFEGINSRLDAMQAALLRRCLPHLEDWNRQRREAASWYDELLGPVDEVMIPRILPDTDPVYHLYVVVVPNREDLRDYLKNQGIGTGLHYPYSLNQLPAYTHLNLEKGSFPRAEYACEHMLSLPVFPGITQEEVQYVCSHISRFCGG